MRRYWPSARRRRRWLRGFRRMPPGAQVISGLCVVALAWALVNVLYQVARKPTELFFPVSGTLFKTPAETWNAYATLFRLHSTDTMSPALLAALAQVEGSGNPIARTYWRWSWHADPFEVYRPASSAVGMYQITDGTFEEAKRFCIHDHVLTEDGPWYAWRSCWLNALYFRVIPSHAIELTSAYLDRAVQTTLERRGIRGATLAQRQKLAALIHLCGAAAGDRFARRGFSFTPGQRCGDHEARVYVERVEAMKAVFAVLASRDR
ncbi:MAG TPA: lytic transglycosylase domain-containing protein [Myxococcota bacterium]|nr:lytic transglycosylase domain-containing protein [Myxococcota bacterium]